MQIGVLGINHKSADVGLREKIARAMNQYFGIFCYQFPFVLLSTCNRTEIYFSSEDLAATHTFLFSVLRNDINFEFEHKIYAYFGTDCFFHLAKVTSGLDSAIVGETEIQGQVKQSYEMACKARALCSELHFLFQKSLKIGKEIRSKWSEICIPFEDLVYQIARNYFSDLESKKILLVGISEINLKVLKKFDTYDLTLCNRTESRALPFGKKILPFALHQSHVFDFDMIIYGTKAQDFLLTKKGQVLSKKLIIDASVPRNVDPNLATDLITVLNIDQITKNSAPKPCQYELETLLCEIQKQIALFKKRQSFYLASV